jgi:hypothetical protein
MCHDQHSQISPNYCMNDFDNDNYCPFRNARGIAAVASFPPKPHTPIGRQKKDRTISYPALLFDN